MFVSIHKKLSTKDVRQIGRGVGLEISDVRGRGRGWFVKIRTSENCLKKFKFQIILYIEIPYKYNFRIPLKVFDRVGDFLPPDN